MACAGVTIAFVTGRERCVRHVRRHVACAANLHKQQYAGQKRCRACRRAAAFCCGLCCTLDAGFHSHPLRLRLLHLHSYIELCWSCLRLDLPVPCAGCHVSANRHTCVFCTSTEPCAPQPPAGRRCPPSACWGHTFQQQAGSTFNGHSLPGAASSRTPNLPTHLRVPIQRRTHVMPCAGALEDFERLVSLCWRQGCHSGYGPRTLPWNAASDDDALQFLTRAAPGASNASARESLLEQLVGLGTGRGLRLDQHHTHIKPPTSGLSIRRHSTKCPCTPLFNI